MAQVEVIKVERTQVTPPRGGYLLNLYLSPISTPAVPGQPANFTYQHYVVEKRASSLSKPTTLLTSLTAPSVPNAEYSYGLDIQYKANFEQVQPLSQYALTQILVGGPVFNPNPFAVPFINRGLSTYFSPPPPVASNSKLELTLTYLGYSAPVTPPPPPLFAFIPNLVGMTLNAAITAISSSIFGLGTVSSKKNSAPSGTVISQSQPANTLAPSGTIINITVSLGRHVGRNEHILPSGIPKNLVGKIEPSSNG